MLRLSLLLGLAACAASLTTPPTLTSARRRHPPGSPRAHPRASAPQLDSCTTSFEPVDIDHFSFAPVNGTLALRVFTCDPTTTWTPGDVIFYYVGNEADVELYVNHTGCVWRALRGRPLFSRRRRRRDSV